MFYPFKFVQVNISNLEHIPPPPEILSIVLKNFIEIKRYRAEPTALNLKTFFLPFCRAGQFCSQKIPPNFSWRENAAKILEEK